MSCARGRQGSWALQGTDASSLAHATAACLALCRGCPRCSYISVAKGECGWFAECELDSLVASYIPGMPTFYSGLVVTRNATNEDDAPWSSEAAVAILGEGTGNLGALGSGPRAWVFTGP